MRDSPLALVECARQVDREGKRFGLSAMIVDDMVKVCDETTHTEVRFGFAQTYKAKRPLCTVDDERTFFGALHNRLDNGEVDMGVGRFRKVETDEEHANRKYAEAYDDETRRMWKSRKKFGMVGGSFVAAGLANRRWG